MFGGSRCLSSPPNKASCTVFAWHVLPLAVTSTNLRLSGKANKPTQRRRALPTLVKVLTGQSAYGSKRLRDKVLTLPLVVTSTNLRLSGRANKATRRRRLLPHWSKWLRVKVLTGQSAYGSKCLQ